MPSTNTIIASSNNKAANSVLSATSAFSEGVHYNELDNIINSVKQTGGDGEDVVEPYPEQDGGRKKKRSSKKGSKKGTKKGKKGTKEMKGGARKGSKKSTKKGSKKGSRKGSRKGSKNMKGGGIKENIALAKALKDELSDATQWQALVKISGPFLKEHKDNVKDAINAISSSKTKLMKMYHEAVKEMAVKKAAKKASRSKKE